MILKTGSVINQYRLLEPLGEGGMGVVFKAWDATLERNVALKFLPARLGEEPEARERLLVEARAAAGLEHPNICTIYETGETESGRVFIAMGCYEGRSLEDLIGCRTFTAEEAVDLAVQIGRGLAAAHAKGITHRDVKPSNVMVMDDGHVKLIDFGIAKVPDSTLTKTGTTLGTTAYMSPEQTRGTATVQSDLWSLGVVLFEIITGRRLFDSPYQGALIFDILYSDPDLDALEGVASPDVVSIIRRCLEKDPAKRYGSAEEVVADLEQSPEALGRWAPAVDGPLPVERPERGEKESGSESQVVAPAHPVLLSSTGRTAPRPGLYMAAAVVVAVLLGALALTLAERPTQTDAREPLSAILQDSGGATSEPDEAAQTSGEALATDGLPQALGEPGGTAIPDGPRDGGVEVPAHAQPPAQRSAVPRPDDVRTGADRQVEEADPHGGEVRREGVSRSEPSERSQVASATLVARAVPSGDVRLGEEQRAGTARFDVLPGDHDVTFTHPSYGSKRTRVQLAAGESKELTCYFEAKVRVGTRLDGDDGPGPFATVFVDGRNTGEFTPAVLTLGPGRHRIGVRREGYETLDPDQMVTVEPSFQEVSESLIFRIARSE